MEYLFAIAMLGAALGCCGAAWAIAGNDKPVAFGFLCAAIAFGLMLCYPSLY